jgi:NifU-like protein involved in Fe-S cluster formation
MVGAPACGDVMKLQIKVGKDGVIEDARSRPTAAARPSPRARW